MADEGKLDEALTALEESKGSIARLEAKNAELIGKLKKASGEEGGKVAELQDKIDQLSESLAKSQRDSEKAVKKAQDEAKAANETAAMVKRERAQIARSKAIADALAEVKVMSDEIDTLTPFFEKQIQVDEDTGEVFHVGKDKAGKEVRKTPSELVAEWAQTDKAKRHISNGPPSSGGGAGNGGGGGTGARKTQDELSAMAPKERADFFAKGGSASD